MEDAKLPHYPKGERIERELAAELRAGRYGAPGSPFLTTRELIRMIRADKLDPARIPEEPLDDPMGVSTGGWNRGAMQGALPAISKGHGVSGGVSAHRFL